MTEARLRAAGIRARVSLVAGDSGSGSGEEGGGVQVQVL